MGLFTTGDKINIDLSSSKEYVPYEKTVKEFKAPTDDSIRLLNEFQEKAKLNLIEKIVIDDNALKATLLVFEDDAVMDKLKVTSKFTLNGTAYLLNFDVDKATWRYKNETPIGPVHQAIIQELKSQFLNALTDKIFKEHKDFKIQIINYLEFK